MTERRAPTPNETSAAPEEILLHNQSLQIPDGQVLRDLETTRAQAAFNGFTVAELVLPSPVEPGSDIDKRLALIDFGEDATTDGRAILVSPTDQTELRNMGITRSRYGLVTLNYHPEDRMVGFAPLRPGQAVTFGRGDDRSSFLLGLTEPDGKKELSSKQATINLGEDGTITIEDHSTNGTRVILGRSHSEGDQIVANPIY